MVIAPHRKNVGCDFNGICPALVKNPFLFDLGKGFFQIIKCVLPMTTRNKRTEHKHAPSFIFPLVVIEVIILPNWFVHSLNAHFFEKSFQTYFRNMVSNILVCLLCQPSVYINLHVKRIVF